MKFIKFFSIYLSVFLIAAFCFVPSAAVFAAEDPSDPAQVEGETFTLYPTAYELFRNYIYGADTELTPEMQLTLTMLATLAALFVVVIPFIVVWFFIRLVCRW